MDHVDQTWQISVHRQIPHRQLDAIGGTPTILIGVAIASSSAMVLPISTPPNALAYATNLVHQNDMAKIGIITGIASMILGYVLLYFIGVSHMF